MAARVQFGGFIVFLKFTHGDSKTVTDHALGEIGLAEPDPGDNATVAVDGDRLHTHHFPAGDSNKKAVAEIADRFEFQGFCASFVIMEHIGVNFLAFPLVSL